MTFVEDKRLQRSAMVAWRAALDEEERRAGSRGLLATWQGEKPFAVPAAVSGFWPFKDEIDIRPLMMELFSAGCQLALPVVQGRDEPLLFRAWRPGDVLEQGVFGTLQPTACREAIEPDALIVPLLACDAEGWRLGYGGGFYDRTLSALRSCRPVTAVGVGFDGQLVDAVPHGPDDQRLDWLLTDRRACAFV
ncbi:MAG: 5-formyltetrahydrofolate cyclo-ligase [Pseudomonadota bacterium]